MTIKAIIRLLILSVGFTLSLLLIRIFYTGSLVYIFFAWNIFLASIPLMVSTRLIQTKGRLMQRLLLAVWLLFLPNALYIVTDLVHLQDRYPVPLWFDSILIFSAAINGLIMAYSSLQQIELFLRSKFNANKTNVIIFGCLFLSSFGVYIGRFLRWNSWDIVLNPFGLMPELIHPIISPFRYSRTWETTAVFTAFFSIFYFTVKKLPAFIIKTGE